MFNQITLIGNLGNNAEVQADGRLLKLSVATSSNYKNKSGEWVNDTEWHNVKLWNDKANEMATRFLKGSRVLVVGSIATSENNEGKKFTFIKARSVKSLTAQKESRRELVICDLCLIESKTQLIGFYLDETDVLHIDQNSNICKPCLGQIKAEIIGTRLIRRVQTSSYSYYSLKGSRDEE